MTRYGVEIICVMGGHWISADYRFEIRRFFPSRTGERAWRIEEWDTMNGEMVGGVGVVDTLDEACQSIANFTSIMQYPVPCGPQESPAR